MEINGSKEQLAQNKNADYFWHRHTSLLDLVDIVDNDKLRRKLKTKILDVANEVREEMKQEKQEKLKEE